MEGLRNQDGYRAPQSKMVGRGSFKNQKCYWHTDRQTQWRTEYVCQGASPQLTMVGLFVCWSVSVLMVKLLVIRVIV